MKKLILPAIIPNNILDLHYELIFSQNQRVLFCEKSKKASFRIRLYCLAN